MYYWIFVAAAFFLKIRNKDLAQQMPCSISNWFYMYAKCLHTSSYSKYSCAILRGRKTGVLLV